MENEALTGEQHGYVLPAGISFLRQSGPVKRGEPVMVLAAAETELLHTIRDPLGIHARPAGSIVKLAKSFKSKVTVCCGDREASAANLMSLLRLGAVQGSRLKIFADGPDAPAAIQALKQYLQENL